MTRPLVGPIHIHVLNTPDLAGYWTGPARLRRRLGTLAARYRVRLTVTESGDATAVTAAMRRATVLVGFNLPHRRIAELPRLRWIQLVSAGVDHLLPIDWLPRGVVLTNSSGLHADLAGEFAAGALLMLNFGVPHHATNQRAGRWHQVLNSPIRGKTVVLIGVGAIGGAAAGAAKRLGLRVLGVRRSRRPHRDVDEMYGPRDLDRILPRADFVVVTAALTPETRGMLGPRQLARLRPGAGLINMARAAIVDYEALAHRLARGWLRGAVVDVTDPEPLPVTSPLWRVPGLLITPHISSDPADYVERTMDMIADNLGRLLEGRPLRNRVGPARGY